ncbi:hypothetical protein FPSE_09980 [Fusarium pseudograminearum CS3096]|uniref:Uncharacterized protein n=1 Tax=Fusarium pseudograminearum (strain CS3096) TaxID=1028729 RepID=K3VY13_FUSPC|nr:hypothetical protein FPSE_09980 [Fusarium pseudograminearum CS3096]EKJ69850.1 hypothetical protein FPSE_09980 [Fusarium pseudograminearum CS3096]
MVSLYVIQPPWHRDPEKDWSEAKRATDQTDKPEGRL